MNKTVIFLFVSFLMVPIYLLGQEEPPYNQAKPVPRCSLFSEFAAGALIGGGIGLGCAYFDKKFSNMQLFSWLASMYMRNAIVEDCIKNLNARGSTLSWTAFWASWFVYLESMAVSHNSRNIYDLGFFGRLEFRR